MIAVIDDDDVVAEATSGLIEAFGLSARTFPSAEAFLDSPYIAQTNCLVVDVHMPGIGGLQLQSALTDSGRRIPVIFITAFPDEHSRERALKAGAVCYLSKPVDPAALLACIRTAMGQREDTPPRSS